MIKFRLLSKYFLKAPIKGYRPGTVIKVYPSKLFQGFESSGQPRYFAEKGKNPEKLGKEEEITVKMPGFIHPETINEEGYFTQKAKQQLEELKRKVDKPSLTNPEKKE